MSPVEENKNIDFKLIFHSAPTLFLLLKPNPPEFTIIEASDNYLKATQTKRYEIVNRGLFDVFPDNPSDLKADGVSNLNRSLNTVLEKKQAHKMAVQKYDIQVTTEQGIAFEERHWDCKNTPVFNEQSEIAYIIHQAEDITENIRLENKMLDVNAELEKKSFLLIENAERVNTIIDALLRYTTMDFSDKLKSSDKGDELDAIIVGLNSLTEELENNMRLLKLSNEDLEYANKELDAFSYSVSHDLRAPLRAINGYSQMLMEDFGNSIDEAGKQTIQTIIKNAHRMGSLIDDLLTFSRVGKQGVTKILLNMNNMVNSVIQEFKNQQQKNEVEYIINSLENSEGDSSMIKQVLTNLISNAIKYSGKKEKAIIEIGSYKKDKNVVYFVKDNGSGFDMKYYSKLFGVFQRLHSTQEFEGTGVGLALVQRILKKHNGEIWAEAVPQQGATFYFSLPLIK